MCKKLEKVKKKKESAGHWWLKPVILATHEAEIRGSWFEVSLGK
jgi:hypothetical protein